MDSVINLVAAGKIEMQIAKRIPLKNVQRAHRLLENQENFLLKPYYWTKDARYSLDGYTSLGFLHLKSLWDNGTLRF
jgi:hypothetical protein